MQFSRSIITIAALIGSSLALPAMVANLDSRQAGLCSSGLSTPLCCDVDVLGAADLNCEQPETVPTSLEDFVDVCAAVGKIDMCCVLPILGQALLCADAS